MNRHTISYTSRQKLKFVTVFLILIIGISSFTPQHQRRKNVQAWEHLGTRKVDFGLEKDVIVVTAAEGRFSKLRFNVTEGNLTMHRMVVVYGNGTRDELPVKHNFSKGSGTRVIDLQGNKRVVKKVIFWYDTKNASSRKATLRLYGKH